MRNTVARIAKPAVIALAGAAAMLSVGTQASAAETHEAPRVPGEVLDAVGQVPGKIAAVPVNVAKVPLAAASTVAEVATNAPVAGSVVAGAPVVGAMAENHESIGEAVGRVPGKVVDVPLAVANVPLTAAGVVAGNLPVGH
ncbi:hypothetical protein FKR81_15255 [Lentzea tibetensis]|uniref:ATP-binding protein n=1 Tax=Lentzea tibetensis TaxID=2591470 RepID=A0A563EVP7_9PSEU|nr:hypothetical protein [Lentzea tibetensis]TWP51551.1 hypothetical protein FKR81_15255 [Lentzea tibetensis]